MGGSGAGSIPPKWARDQIDVEERDDFCSGAFGVDDAVNDSNVVRLDDHDGHSSIRSLVDEGYEVITF